MSGSNVALGQHILWRLEAFGYDMVTAVLRAMPVNPLPMLITVRS